MPVDPAKHAAYAVWNALEQRPGAPWQSCSCRALVTHWRVAGLNGCGWSVVEVVEVVVDVVGEVGLAVGAVTWACTAPRGTTMRVRNPIVTVVDGRNMVQSPRAGRRARRAAARVVMSMVSPPVPLVRTSRWLRAGGGSGSGCSRSSRCPGSPQTAGR